MILTSDAATILRELDVVHPAAKLLVMASQQQDAEMGDGTNLVIVLAGELLKKAEELIRLGLKTSDITSGYEKAQNFALKVLEGMFGLFFIILGSAWLWRPILRIGEARLTNGCLPGFYEFLLIYAFCGRSRGRSTQGDAFHYRTQQGPSDGRC